MTENPVKPVDQAEITRLLEEIEGSPELFDRLVPMVYDDLKRLGRSQRRRLGGSATLQTTALVHEAFLKLRGHAESRIENRLHFQRLAIRVMRQLIFDYARKKLSAKRGGGQLRETWDESDYAGDEEDLVRVMAVEQALARIEQTDGRLAEVLSAKIFSGHTVSEIAEMLGVSTRTIVRDLRRARAWMRIELRDFDPGADS